MGTAGSTTNPTRRRNPNPNYNYHHHNQTHPSPPPEIAGNRYVYPGAAPYPPPYLNPSSNPHPSPRPYYYYPSHPPPLPVPFVGGPHQPYWPGAGRYPGGSPPQPAPYVEHQKAVTVRNDVNVKKETLRVEPDRLNPGSFLVAFTFDATVAGSITVYFFAKEGLDSNLTTTKDNLLDSVTVPFKEGLGQEFRQPSGTGIDFSMFEEVELVKQEEMEVYPLSVKAEAAPDDDQIPPTEHQSNSLNSQITQAVFEKMEQGKYRVRVVKQILWVNGTRYELQEIYGIGNSGDSGFDENDTGKDCVICLSEPRDTTVLPCRHMCMCNGCAKLLRLQTNRCPICRQPVESLLEIKVTNQTEGEEEAANHD